jgi:hypothetical protein
MNMLLAAARLFATFSLLREIRWRFARDQQLSAG